jgi:hypothetical protein
MHRLSLPPSSLQVLDYHTDPDPDGARLILAESRQVERAKGGRTYGAFAILLDHEASGSENVGIIDNRHGGPDTAEVIGRRDTN